MIPVERLPWNWVIMLIALMRILIAPGRGAPRQQLVWIRLTCFFQQGGAGKRQKVNLELLKSLETLCKEAKPSMVACRMVYW